jgi:hypothetical protein
MGSDIRVDLGGNTVGRYELDSSGSAHGPLAVSREDGNEPSGFIKGREFLD